MSSPFTQIAPKICTLALALACSLAPIGVQKGFAQSGVLFPPASSAPNLPNLGLNIPAADLGGTITGNGSAVASYERDTSVVRDIMNAQVKRSASQAGAYGTDNSITDKLSLPPLPGEESFADSTSDAARFAPNGGVPKNSRQKYEDFQIRMPALIGMRQMMNAEPIKNMLRELTTTKVPVLFQTMMMVENGAATGYIGSLNAINGIMQTTMQTNDLQMKLMDLTDHTGMQKEAYARRMQVAFSETGEDAWPAALYGALGDRADGTVPTFNKMAGAKAFGLENLRGSKPGAKEVLLTDLLFFEEDAAKEGPESLRQLRTLKQDFAKYLGDFKLEEVAASGTTSAVSMRLTRIKPEARDKRRGLARAKWEEHGVAFESLAKVLKMYCEFKQKGDNIKLQPFEKKSAALSLQQAMDMSRYTPSISFGGSTKHSPWEYASAPDLPLSFNLVEQLYMVIMKTTLRESQLNCNSLDLKAADMSSMMAAAPSKTANLDDCSQNSGCVRNRLLVFISDIVARSRALHLYRGLVEQSYKFAVTPELKQYLTQMLQEEFGDFDMNEEIYRNRQRWNEYQEFLARAMQGQSGGSSSFRPNTESNVANSFHAGH